LHHPDGLDAVSTRADSMLPEAQGAMDRRTLRDAIECLNACKRADASTIPAKCRALAVGSQKISAADRGVSRV